MPDDYLEIGLMLDASPATAGALAATQSFRTILDVLSEARNQAAQLGEQTYRFRDAMRDIQAMKGGGPVTDETMREQINLMRQTSLTGVEQHEFTEKFLGEAAAYLGPYSPEQRQQFQVLTGKYGAMMGVDPATMATLAGRVIGLHPEGITPEQNLAESAEFYRRVGMGSGEASLAAASALGVGASLVQPGGAGPIRDLGALGTLAMGASRGGSEHTIGTTIQSFATAMQGLSSETWRKHLREDLRIPEGTHVEDAMFTVFAELEKIANVPEIAGSDEQRAAATRALAEGETPQGRDLGTALQEMGINNIRQRRAILTMYGQRHELRRMQEGVVRGPEDVRITAPMATEQLGQWERDPLTGGARLARSGGEAQQREQGMQDEEALTYLINEQTRLRQAGRIEGPGLAENALRDILLKPTGLRGDAALIYQGAQETWERQNRTRLNKEEPGLLSWGASWALAGMPILTEMAYEGLGGPVKEGAKSYRDVRKDIEDTIETYTGNRAVGFGQRIQIARGNQDFDNLANRTMMGPNAQMMTPEEYRQYGRTELHWTPQQEAENMPKWMKRLGEELTKVVNQGPGPIGGVPPKPANGLRK